MHMENLVEDFTDVVTVAVIDEEDVETNRKIDNTSDDLDDLLANLN